MRWYEGMKRRRRRRIATLIRSQKERITWTVSSTLRVLLPQQGFKQSQAQLNKKKKQQQKIGIIPRPKKSFPFVKKQKKTKRDYILPTISISQDFISGRLFTLRLKTQQQQQKKNKEQKKPKVPVDFSIRFRYRFSRIRLLSSGIHV